MRSIDETDEWGEYYSDPEGRYQPRRCVFCGQTLGRNEYLRFNFPYKQKYLVAHYDCFCEKCRDNGASEDGIQELLECLGIEIEY